MGMVWSWPNQDWNANFREEEGDRHLARARLRQLCYWQAPGEDKTTSTTVVSVVSAATRQGQLVVIIKDHHPWWDLACQQREEISFSIFIKTFNLCTNNLQGQFLASTLLSNGFIGFCTPKIPVANPNMSRRNSCLESENYGRVSMGSCGNWFKININLLCFVILYSYYSSRDYMKLVPL